MDHADEQPRSSDVLVADLRAEVNARFGEVNAQIGELRVFLIGIDGENGIRGELRAIRKEITGHVASDVRHEEEARQARGRTIDQGLEDKKSRRILVAAVIAALLASPVLTRAVDLLIPEKIHATETQEVHGPAIIQGEVK